jgi:hypothetical protein
MSEIPKVAVTDAITAKEKDGTLVYPKLQDQVKLHTHYERDRRKALFAAQDGSVEEQQAAIELANYYLILSAFNAVEPFPIASQETWIERFTNASIDLYGAPDPERAEALLFDHIATYESLASNDAVDKSLLAYYLEKLYKFQNTRNDNVHDVESGITSERLYEIAAEVRLYFESEFGYFTDMFAYDDPNALNSPEQIAEKINQSLPELVNRYPGFEGWQVKIIPDKDNLSVSAPEKLIKVGKNRRPVSNRELMGLFFHEVVIHALRSVRGAEYDDLLRTGLPKYSDGEEGLGTFVEFAMTGVIPDKNPERYIDIALALGTLHEGDKMPRRELLDIVMSRELLKAQASGVVDTEYITQKVQAHVNQIYRGTPGEDIPGVYTRGILYQIGFDTIATYMSDKLAGGMPINKLMEYLLSGKFDPTNSDHEQYVRKFIA